MGDAWLSELLLRGGVFGFEFVTSGWIWAAWIVAALVAGNAVAFIRDRIFVRQREPSRPLGRVS